MRRRQAFALAGQSRPAHPHPVELTEADLRALYARHFGKPPHHRMKLDTIREKLRDADLG